MARTSQQKRPPDRRHDGSLEETRSLPAPNLRVHRLLRRRKKSVEALREWCICHFRELSCSRRFLEETRELVAHFCDLAESDPAVEVRVAAQQAIEAVYRAAAAHREMLRSELPGLSSGNRHVMKTHPDSEN